MIKTKKWPIILFMLMSMSQLAQSQTYDQIIKLRAEYEKLKEAQDLQAAMGQSTVPGEDGGPTRVLYRPEDLQEFYRIQLSQLIQSMKDINEINAFFDSTTGFNHFGYDVFLRRDSIAYFENMPLPEDYSLGPGDEIIVSLWGQIEQETKSIINRDGNIFLEDIGLIHLGGKTLAESKLAIRNKYESTYATLKGKQPKSFLDVSLGTLKGLNVHILGFVKNPGVYALHPFSNPFTAIVQAGGVDTVGSLRHIEVYRNREKIHTMDLYQLLHYGNIDNTIRLMNQDIIFIPPRESKVLINGEIVRPGYYELIENETAEDLLNYSGGQLPKGSNTQIVKRIHPPKIRNNDDNAVEYFSVKLSDASSFKIVNGDSVGVPQISDYHPTITLNGMVKSPGVFPYIKDQNLIDVLHSYGGLRDEVWRQFVNPKIVVKRIDKNGQINSHEFDLEDLLNNDVDFILSPYDEILVSQSNQYLPHEVIQISGEIKTPGFYSIRGKSIEALISDAGGTSARAFHEGIELYRDTLKIGIDNLKMIPQSGDSIHIPLRPGTVEVLGAVNNPGLIGYTPGESLGEFIEKAGGYTVYANKKDIFVIYPNGTAKRKTRFSTPKVTEGSTIMVSGSQLVVQQVDYLETSQQIASIIGSLATVALIINTQK